MAGFLWIVIFHYLSQFYINATEILYKECINHASMSLSISQRQQLCHNDNSSQVNLFPAVCSRVVKELVHLSHTSDVIEICQHVTKLGFLHCLESLDKKHHTKEMVKSLCFPFKQSPFQPTNKLSTCFNDLKTKVTSLSAEDISIYCTSLRNVSSAMSCVDHHKRDSSNWNTNPHSLRDVLTSCSTMSSQFDRCMEDMAHLLLHNRHGVSQREILQFCLLSSDDSSEDIPASPSPLHEAVVTPMAMVECFYSSSLLERVKSAVTLSGAHRLTLCLHAHRNNSIGPVDCAMKLLTSSPGYRLDPLHITSLCQGALDDTPASCLLDNPRWGPVASRIELCKGPASQLEYTCISEALKTGKALDLPAIRELCRHSNDSSNRVACFQYTVASQLPMADRVALCRHLSPLQRADSSHSCFKRLLQIMTHSSKPVQVAAVEQQLVNRTVEICSVAPESVLQCADSVLKLSAQYPIDINEIYSVCSSREGSREGSTGAPFPALLPRCYERLHQQHRHYSPREMIAFCAAVSSPEELSLRLSCISSLAQLPTAMLAAGDSLEVCRYEDKAGSIHSCVQQAFQASYSSGTNSPLSKAIVIDSCQQTRHSRHGDPVGTGKCLHQLLFQSAYRDVRQLYGVIDDIHMSPSWPHDSSGIRAVCLQEDANALLHCLRDNIRKGYLPYSQQRECQLNYHSVPTSVSLHTLYSKETQAEGEGGGDRTGAVIEAMRPFVVEFLVNDQYHSRLGRQERYTDMFSVSINENNPQSAVLWGQKTAVLTEASGLISFPHLLVTVAGPVEVKISHVRYQGERVVLPKRVLGSYQLTVQASHEPAMQLSEMCVQELLVTAAMCPVGQSDSQREFLFPAIHDVLPYRSLYLAVVCQDHLRRLFIDTYFLTGSPPHPSSLPGKAEEHTTPISALAVISYRMDIESLWIPRHPQLPRADMSPEAILDIPHYSQSLQRLKQQSPSSSKERQLLLKAVKRQYYKKSLLWHPDRWSGMGIYQSAAQHSFELIVTAYERLVQDIASIPVDR